jgi:hypothetical protein
MPLPASGPISFNNINVELGVAGTTQASLGQASYRALAGVASGQISMSNFYGKANEFTFAIASNQTNANLRTLAVNAGWNQTSKVVATINSGVYVSANSTGTPGLTINGSFPNGVELTNNGFIIGMGGAGGGGGGVTGFAGGTALAVSIQVSIRNNGTVGGGGGGGGAGNTYDSSYCDKGGCFPGSTYGGGGGGGGRTGSTNSAGGAGRNATYPGGAGGAGTSASAGGGGSPNGSGAPYATAGASGGNWGSAGGSAAAGAGGAAGAAVTGNGTINWLATGTRLGAIT